MSFQLTNYQTFGTVLNILVNLMCSVQPQKAGILSGSGALPQTFIRQPVAQTAIQGEHVTLPCQVENKRGMLQWTRDGFGLGVERNLTGFDRYHMIGSDEEGM